MLVGDGRRNNLKQRSKTGALAAKFGKLNTKGREYFHLKYIGETAIIILVINGPLHVPSYTLEAPMAFNGSRNHVHCC